MKTYKTISDILLAMTANGELTVKQMQAIREAHENERAEWRNKLIHITNEAYDAGTKHNAYEREELVDDIRKGGYDV